MAADRRAGGASGLLWLGAAVFLVGVAVAFFGGEELAMVGLGIQVAGAAVLALNAARSRRELFSSSESDRESREREDDSEPRNG